MTRRALTLLELLVVIGLLVAVGALVAPAAVEGLRERAFTSSVDVLRHQLLLARAHAQETGRPVELRYEARPPRVGVLLYPALQAEAPPPGFEAGAAADGSDADADDERRPAAIPAGWAERALADGVTLRDRPPQPQAPAAPAFTRDGPEAASEPPPRLRLALFLPDGSALVGGPVWLADRHGRLAEISINAWTGLPEATRVFGEPRDADEASGADEVPLDDALETDDAPPDRFEDDGDDGAQDGEEAPDEQARQAREDAQEEDPT